MPPFADLGEFLRARRARLRPGDVGLPAGTGLRRTPGLRREELAALAGISIDYYIRLEQGRETNPSPAVLDGLADALLLNDEERGHLHLLARRASRRADRTEGSPGAAPRRGGAGVVRPGVRQLLETLRPCPAQVLSPISDVLASNPEALALFDGLTDWPADRRNTIRYTFLHPTARELFADWPKAAASTAANLRTVASSSPDTPGLAALVDELNAESPEFARLWQRYDVRRRRGEPKTFHHPRVGTITLSFDVLYLTDEGQRISIHQAAPGSTDHDALALLALLAAEPPGTPTTG